MDKIKEILRVRNALADAKRDRDRGVGIQSEHEKTLKERFSCDTIEAAERKIEQLTRKGERLATEFQEGWEKFRSEHIDRLGDDE